MPEKKTKICGIVSCAIIFLRNAPRNLFLEIKDDGHPLPSHRRKLCFIGGHWSGKEAKEDVNTLSTFVREFSEEFSPEHSTREEYRLSELDFRKEFLSSRKSDFVSAYGWEVALDCVKNKILESAVPFCDFISKFRSEDKDFRYLLSYMLVPLCNQDWNNLWLMQKHFNNLSNESISCCTSLEEIISCKAKFVSGHDHVLQRFLAPIYPALASKMSLEPAKITPVGPPLPTYHDYLAKYDIAHTPFNP